MLNLTHLCGFGGDAVKSFPGVAVLENVGVFASDAVAPFVHPAAIQQTVTGALRSVTGQKTYILACVTDVSSGYTATPALTNTAFEWITLSLPWHGGGTKTLYLDVLLFQKTNAAAQDVQVEVQMQAAGHVCAFSLIQVDGILTGATVTTPASVDNSSGNGSPELTIACDSGDFILGLFAAVSDFTYPNIDAIGGFDSIMTIGKIPYDGFYSNPVWWVRYLEFTVCLQPIALGATSFKGAMTNTFTPNIVHTASSRSMGLIKVSVPT